MHKRQSAVAAAGCPRIESVDLFDHRQHLSLVFCQRVAGKPAVGLAQGSLVDHARSGPKFWFGGIWRLHAAPCARRSSGRSIAVSHCRVIITRAPSLNRRALVGSRGRHQYGRALPLMQTHPIPKRVPGKPHRNAPDQVALRCDGTTGFRPLRCPLGVSVIGAMIRSRSVRASRGQGATVTFNVP